MKRLRFFLFCAIFAGVSVAGVKNVAVVETETDAQSGAAALLNPAEVRQITAVLRKEAVKNLPQGKYNIMTTETVYAQGGAVLEECADENCVITLGSKIGADYIVRGTVSKFGTMLTVSVDIYETDDGNLVASSELVRSENIVELLDKTAGACADMYKTFANAQRSTAPTPISAPKPEPAKIAAESAIPAAKRPAETVPAPSSPKPGGVVNVPGDAKTISEAMWLAGTGGYGTVLVAPGVYRERIVMIPDVALVSASLFGAKIDGGGRGIVITMAENTSIIGFEIRNGAVGIFSKDDGNEIRRCRIINNGMTGIMAKSRLPQIEDNIVAFNKASGIQAWDIEPTAAAVNHNTIAYNGNNGIAVGGSSEFVIEYNVIAFNEWHGFKASRKSENVTVSGNNFYGNLFLFDKTLPNGNYAFDPAFSQPFAELNFNPIPGKCCKKKDADGENLGARLNYRF